MHRAYKAGDKSQLNKLIEIVSRPDYPYATRKKAAEVLGEIGEPAAVPALIGVLRGFDRRTTLKITAMTSLAMIGDDSAVQPIGQLLDRSLNDSNAEVRLAAMPVLGRIGGERSAEILVSALTYYDVLMLQDERKSRRGVFTGEETDLRAMRDSLRGPAELFGDPTQGGGLFGDRMPRITMFGTSMDAEPQLEETTPQERAVAHSSLVSVGDEAVSVILAHMEGKHTTVTLKKELLAIIKEIQTVDAESSGS